MVNKPGKDIVILRRMQKSTLLSPISLSSTQSQYGKALSTVEIFHRQIFQTFFLYFKVKKGKKDWQTLIGGNQGSLKTVCSRT